MSRSRSAASGTGRTKRKNNVVCTGTGGELCERSFAHCYQTGAMRRMYVRGQDNVFKRVLVQAAAFNIGLLLCKLSGWGKPRGG
jgi:hypothetical protein